LLALACQTAPPPRPVSTEHSIQSVSNQAMLKPDGGTFKLAEARGKVVVVDVWATWCGPCRQQAPKLAELNARYHDRGLEVIGLSLDDPKEHQAEVAQFMRSAGINYTIAYASRRVSDAFLHGTEDETGAPPIPQLFVLSRAGRLVEHFIGEDPARGLAPLEQVINQQLSLTAPPR
jgi:thiol-disulfide isomerase/thioredoxin